MERRPRRQLSNVSSTAAATVTATALGATATLTATAIAAVAAATTTVAVAATAIAAAAIPSDRPSSGGLPGPTAEPGQGRTSRWGEQLDLRPPCVARPG